MYKSISNNPLVRMSYFPSHALMTDIFNESELQSIIDNHLLQGVNEANVGIDNKPVADIRISRIRFHTANEDNMWIFDRLNKTIEYVNEQFYNFNLYGYDSYQFTEYRSEEKGFYNWHMDTFLGGIDPNFKGTRKLSLSLLLNDDFEGGNFLINEGEEKMPIKISLKKGTAVIFPSFMCHKVEPIIKGNRYSLVVWVNGPKFI